MMNSCWENDPQLRPPFSQLVTDIGKDLEEAADYLDVDTFPTQSISEQEN